MSARRFLRRPTYADVAATLALVFAMSGTAFAVTATVADPGSVDTAAIQNLAVTTPKLADEAATSAKIAPNAVTGAKVKNLSLTSADLAGVSLTGPINFTLAAHACGYVFLNVPGAKVGQLAVLNWVGTSNPPQGIMVGPLKVVSVGHARASFCNLTGHKIIGTGVKVRVTTLT